MSFPFQTRAAPLRGLFFVLASISISAFGHSQTESGSLTRGTLNVVLANKNGFVMAADSRQSFGDCPHGTNDSQKVFQMGPNAAMAIAGFATYRSGSYAPYAMEVAAVLREHFDQRFWHLGSNQFFVDTWLDVQVLPDIQGLAAIYEATIYQTPPSRPFQRFLSRADFSFIATSAWIGPPGAAEGVPYIRQVRFVPRVIKFGPLGNTYYEYVSEVDEVSADHFISVTAGIDVWAIRILNGVEQDADPAVVKYLFALERGARNELSLEDMEGVARRLLKITGEKNSCVGGDAQVAVVPTTGPASWSLLPADPDHRERIQGSRLSLGLAYNGSLPNKEPLMVHPDSIRGNRIWTRVFADSRFENSRVLLDGNFFIGNLFTNPTFLWNGGVFAFRPSQNWIQGNCIIEFGINAPQNRLPMQFAACRKKIASKKLNIYDYVGFPIVIEIQKTDRPGISIIKIPY
jgi:hypothetical protein